MTKLINIVVLLLVLPALILAETEASNKCKITVSSKLVSSDRKTNTYDGTVTNIGSAAAANVFITPSADLRSVSNLKDSGRGYSLPSAKVSAGGIPVGGTHSFSYTVAKGNNVKWSVSCTDGSTTSTSAPATKAPTSAPATKAPTSAPTTKATSAPATKAPTSAPATKAPTSAPATKAPTSAPATKAPTSAPATKAPTSAPATKAPTSAPATKAPTTKPTSAPTGGKICPAGTWWAPAPQTTWQWQLTGSVDTSVNVQMFDIDLFDATTSLIQTLHSKGKVVICYFSTQYENWRPDASSFTSAVLGNDLDDWAGEKYVDIRSSVVRNIMSARLDLAASKGCDGVEPDNVDGYQASTGFPLKAADQLNYNQYLASQAHARGLSIGLKNDLDQSSALEPYFDWALNEQCKEYSECDSLNNFIAAGKAVFNTEYSGSASSLCPYMVGIKFSSLLKDLSLSASIKAQCCSYQSNGCAAVPHQCVSSTLKKRDLDEVEGEDFVNEELNEEFTTEEFTNDEFAPEQQQQEAPAIAATNAAATSYVSIASLVAVGLAVAILNL